MPLVDAVCPHCGAPLKVNPDAKTLTCRYCGNDFVVQDAITNINIKDSHVTNVFNGATVVLNNDENKRIDENKSNWPKPISNEWVAELEKQKTHSYIIWIIVCAVVFVIGVILSVFGFNSIFSSTSSSSNIVGEILAMSFGIMFSCFGGVFFIYLIIRCFMKKYQVRKIDDYTIAATNTISGIVMYIENVKQENSSKYVAYGTLPNGKPITAEANIWTGDITIEIR